MAAYNMSMWCGVEVSSENTLIARKLQNESPRGKVEASNSSSFTGPELCINYLKFSHPFDANKEQVLPVI